MIRKSPFCSLPLSARIWLSPDNTWTQGRAAPMAAALNAGQQHVSPPCRSWVLNSIPPWPGTWFVNPSAATLVLTHPKWVLQHSHWSHGYTMPWDCWTGSLDMPLQTPDPPRPRPCIRYDFTWHTPAETPETGINLSPFAPREEQAAHQQQLSCTCPGAPGPCPTTSTADPALALGGSKIQSRTSCSYERTRRLQEAARGETAASKAVLQPACTYHTNTFSSSNSFILQQGQDDKSDYIKVHSFTQLSKICKFTIRFNGRITCLFVGNYRFSFKGFNPFVPASPRVLSRQLLCIPGQTVLLPSPTLHACNLTDSSYGTFANGSSPLWGICTQILKDIQVSIY